LWTKEEPIKPIRISVLAPEQLAELEELYRTTRDARLSTRAQMVLLAAERRLVAEEIAGIVRASEETVRRWLKRYMAEGIEGLRDAPHPGAPRKVTAEYREQLLHAVRRRPRSLGQPFSLWTLRRLADYMAERTGIRVEYETVRVHLKAEGIVLSRPQHTYHTGQTVVLIRRRKRRPEVTELLEALLEKHPTGRVYVAWDNSNTHEDEEIEELLRGATGRLVLLYLPTYSPWLNPIEMLWRHFRREVTHCELFPSVKALIGAA
jgi:transposase